MPTWKMTHKGSVEEVDKDNPLRGDSVISGLVIGLTDDATQLATAIATALAPYTTSSLTTHPDTDYPIKDIRARWERGDTGDGQGAIARVDLIFGIGGSSGITGGTVNGWTIISGTWWDGAEAIIPVKGPGDGDRVSGYGSGRIGGFDALIAFPTNAVPLLPVGAQVASTVYFDAAQSVSKTANVVIQKFETVGIGYAQVTARYIIL